MRLTLTVLLTRRLMLTLTVIRALHDLSVETIYRRTCDVRVSTRLKSLSVFDEKCKIYCFIWFYNVKSSDIDLESFKFHFVDECIVTVSVSSNRILILYEKCGIYNVYIYYQLLNVIEQHNKLNTQTQGTNTDIIKHVNSFFKILLWTNYKICKKKLV